MFCVRLLAAGYRPTIKQQILSRRATTEMREREREKEKDFSPKDYECIGQEEVPRLRKTKDKGGVFRLAMAQA